MQVNTHDPDQTPPFATSEQDLHCLLMSHKRMLGSMGYKNEAITVHIDIYVYSV